MAFNLQVKDRPWPREGHKEDIWKIVTGRWLDVAVEACGIVLLASFIH